MAEARVAVTKEQFESFKNQMIESSDDRCCGVIVETDPPAPDFIPAEQLRLSDYVAGRTWFVVVAEARKSLRFRYDEVRGQLVTRI